MPRILKFAFISYFPPTEKHKKIALENNIELIHVHDSYALTDTSRWIIKNTMRPPIHFDGVISTEPSVAICLYDNGFCGAFENANLAEIGQPPQLEPVALRLYNM